MKIADNCVASVEYVAKDKQGRIVDRSPPVSYIHGQQEIIAGLEQGLTGMGPGERATFEVSPEQAFGFRDEERVIKIDRRSLPLSPPPEVGRFVSFNDPSDPITLQIVEVGEYDVVLDGNHPLAGQAIVFDVHVLDVRPATQDELNHRIPPC